ncbi:MAG: hypothetical protein U5K54_15720 [Cytophagales bacterium]|nr:hypothetical protein [Cytophagales bacterium]
MKGWLVALAKKSGAPEQTVRELIAIMNQVVIKEKISASELKDLNKAIEKFQLKK